MLITFPLLLILLARLIFAVAVSFCVLKMFEQPISAIFGRIIEDKISGAFIKYVKLATYLVAVARGISVPHGGYRLAETLSELPSESKVENFNREIMDELYNEFWFMEIYGIIVSAIIEALRAIVHVYLLLFGLALIAYIMVRLLELLEAKQK